MFRFASNDIEPRDRFEFWADAVNKSYTPLRMEPAGDHPFFGEIAIESVGDVEIVLASGAGQISERTKAEIARSRDHFYMVMVNVGGEPRYYQPGGAEIDAVLHYGDVLLIDTTHELGFGLERPFQSLQLKIPVAWLEQRFSRPDVLCGTVLKGNDPIAQLFTGYLAAGFKSAAALPLSARGMFGQHLMDLLAEAMGQPQAAHAAPARRAAMYARARRTIALRYGESSLGPETIARDLGISTRTLHRLFAENGSTVMNQVFAERIRRAAALLASPGARTRTVTDIGFACGFSELSHFGRVFEAHMNATPSRWRRQES